MKEPLGGPWHGLENNSKIVLTEPEWKVMAWIHLALDRDKWWHLV
jgi:hypothetical protein